MANQQKRRKETTRALPPKQEKKLKAQKRAKAVHIIVSCLCVLIFLGFVGYSYIANFDVSYRKGTAVEVNGTKLSVADYNFYFYRSYYEYLNKMGASTADIGINVLPSEQLPLNRQVAYTDESGDVTWQSFFESRAETLIGRTFVYYAMAQAQGFTLSPEQEAEIQYDFDEKIWFEAEEIEQTSVAEYLTRLYGKGMTEEIYKQNLRALFIANFFEEACKANIEIPDAELDAAYAQAENDYAIAFYRLFYLSGKAAREAEQPAKMRQAKERAEQLLAQAASYADFIALCEEYQQYNDENSYWQGPSTLERSQLRHSMSTLRPWLSDPARKAGDKQVVEAANGYYVLWFQSRPANDYPTVNLKYITISDAAGLEQAAQKAEMFLDAWKKGERTAASFYEVAKEYRDIDYSKENHKMAVITYDALNKASIPLVMMDWCYGQKRTAGDTMVFRSEEEGVVYVAYFDGYGRLASRALAYNDQCKAAFEEWKQEALGSAAVKERFFFFLTAKK